MTDRIPGTVNRGTPNGLLKWFLRMPIWLYRAQLGWLLGNRFILLKHIGRKSGLTRYAVVEVVYHDKLTNTYTIASGWGENSDWLLNLLKTPHIKETTYRGELEVTAYRLSNVDAAIRLAQYAQKYPTAFKSLVKMMLGPDAVSGPIDTDAVAQVVPVVDLVPRKK